MRSTPEIFEKFSTTVLAFDAMSAGITHSRFDMLCTSHGDGNKYAWPAADQERTYEVERGSHQEYSEGWPINDWTLSVTMGGLTRKISVDCINVKLADEDGGPVNNQLANEVFRTTVDAGFERDERDASVPFFLTQSGTKIPNINYRPPIS